ncbi:MAG: tRNA (N(6)-L-threonylcarbamoyladenosine(37)-C(2))-methylthiotransferase MtaB [Clostridia bacterium]|nr:tRNA (N(6)-L-threonylcarbamoyladenosine(37)-C(2))-methylthiotransferase MtaB [Clostridia bacterium]
MPTSTFTQKTNQPSVGICTLGCKVNQYESEAFTELFCKEGFRILSPSEPCDVYVINTCTVTAESDRKARQFIRRAIAMNPSAYVIVTGCYAQVSPDAVAEIEGVDVVIGNQDKTKIPSYARAFLEKREKKASATISVSPIEDAPFEPMRISRFDRTRAYVKIEDGCESRCTYCIIPNARGRIRSKALSDVIEEVDALTRSGCPEVVLTGIETASYGRDLNGVTLASLLQEVDRIPNIGRVRLGSLDPSLIKPAFVTEIKDLRSLTPHFHLSMQSGSSSVLRRMKRKYNREQALDALSLLREAIPRVQFTTDIIVGFPGESDEEFLDTVSLIRDGRFLMAHIFPYSKRKGTPAAEMPDQIPEQLKHERLSYLSEIAKESRRLILRGAVEKGRTEHVLFETHKNGYITGHTDTFLEVCVKSDEMPKGTPVPVKLISSDDERCTGVLLSGSELL